MIVITSYVDGQAYREVIGDEYPILIVTAMDIALCLGQMLLIQSILMSI